METVTWERVVPDALNSNVLFQKNILDQHVERYKFAARYVERKRVLDAACGVGYGSELLFKSGATSVVGIDLDPDTVIYADKRYGEQGITFIVDDLDCVTFEASSADVVVSFETVEHLDNPRRFLRMVSNALTDNGLLIASVPVVPTVDIDEFHKHDFSKRSWRKLVTSSGYAIEDELFQRYRATFKDMKDELKAENTSSGARRNQGRYYLMHPVRAVSRVARVLIAGGLDLDVLTLVCRKK